MFWCMEVNVVFEYLPHRAQKEMVPSIMRFHVHTVHMKEIYGHQKNQRCKYRTQLKYHNECMII